MDFFTVPTLTFGILYCFFVIAHGRRRVLHFNVTPHPTHHWVCQQLRDAPTNNSVLTETIEGVCHVLISDIEFLGL
jgi:hypothetical protein